MIVCGGFGIDGGRISIHGHPQLLFGSLDLSIPSQIIVSDEQKVAAPLEFLVLDVVIVAFELFPADSPFTETKPFVLIFTKPFAVADPDHL